MGSTFNKWDKYLSSTHNEPDIILSEEQTQRRLGQEHGYEDDI